MTNTGASFTFVIVTDTCCESLRPNESVALTMIVYILLPSKSRGVSKSPNPGLKATVKCVASTALIMKAA